jgi:hypothetical protein
MSKLILNFCIKLLIIVLIVFSIHIFILYKLNKPLFEAKILLAYGVNFSLALLIYATLLLLKKKYLDILGFIFMAGSFLKFSVFFIFFYPSYTKDKVINPLETSAFLIPYLTCLIVETFYLIKLLKNKV